MNTNELRIGNYVLCDGKPEKVTGIIQYGVYFDFGYCPNIGLIKPIELTNGWLISLEFETDEILYYNSKLAIGSFKDGYYYTQSGISGISGIKIEYVHQLQNLYFALTGEEL